MVFGDVRDPGSVRSFVDGAAAVYHLAALGSVPYSYSAPRSFVDTNTIGTLHVLEAVRACQTPRLVHTSTSETYGTARTVPISEAHPLQAQSPYAASKVGADKLVESYFLSFGLPGGHAAAVQHLRPAAVDPGRHPAGHHPAGRPGRAAAQAGRAGPDAGLLLRDRHRAGVHRRWARRPARRSSARCSTAARATTWPSAALAEEIAALMGVDADIVEDAQRLRPKDSEVMRLVCDATKLRERTGWRPRWTATQGLRQTIEWFSDPANLAYYTATGYQQ